MQCWRHACYCLQIFPQIGRFCAWCQFPTAAESVLSCRGLSGSFLEVIMAGPYLVLSLSTCSGSISARAHWLMASYYLNSPFLSLRRTSLTPLENVATACWLYRIVPISIIWVNERPEFECTFYFLLGQCVQISLRCWHLLVLARLEYVLGIYVYFPSKFVRRRSIELYTSLIPVCWGHRSLLSYCCSARFLSWRTTSLVEEAGAEAAEAAERLLILR